VAADFTDPSAFEGQFKRLRRALVRPALDPALDNLSDDG